MAEVYDYYYKRAYYVKRRHKRHKFFRHRDYSFQSAVNYNGYKGANDYPRDNARYIKRTLKRRGYSVDLSHRAYSERREQTKNRKYNRKPLLTESLFNIIHRAAHPLAFFVFSAEIYAERIFGKARHHTEQSRNPHPKYRTRSAGGNSGGYAYNVARAYRCGKSRCKCLKLRYGFFVLGFCYLAVFKNCGNRIFNCVAKTAYLKKSRTAREIKTGKQHQYEHRRPPNDAVYLTVDILNKLYKILHSTSECVFIE